jgi:oxygen-dependent protoporphyrinogen oxidase
MSVPAHVVVIGGGITGLSAAYRLMRSDPALRVTVLEADHRPGGRVCTEMFAGRPIDVGAEALLARVPQAAALCRELGLGERVVAPATDRPYVWSRGRLRPLPPRMLAGLPDGLLPLVRSRILSPAGLMRAGLDLVAPARPLERDVTIGSLVRRRLGNEVHERLVDPLLGGIHAGSCDELSLRAVAPTFEAAMRTRKGLVRGLRTVSGAPARFAGGVDSSPRGAAGTAPGGSGLDAPTPIFLGLLGGLGELVSALQRALGDGPTAHGGWAQLRCGASVAAVELLGAGRVRVQTADGDAEIADRVLLATPAFEAARILEPVLPEAARALRRIDYASVATILLEYPKDALPAPLAGSGFLVPRSEHRSLTACTWSSTKWTHLEGASVVLKASVGRAGDEAALTLGDESLVDRIHGELAEAIGLRREPVQASVARFERSLPQYRVGHLELVTQIERALVDRGGVRVAGAAYRGVGVASCIRAAEAAAREIVAELAPERVPAAPLTT